MQMLTLNVGKIFALLSLFPCISASLESVASARTIFFLDIWFHAARNN